MHLPTPSLTTLRSAIRGLSTESAEKAAVQRVMDGAGCGHLWPQTAHGKVGSATVRVHIWPAVEGCRERVALIAGPSIRGDVRLLYPHAPGQPAGDLYIPASGRNPALTDAAPARRNPDGGRESAGTDSSFAQLQRAVHGTASEQGQLNLVARVLAGKGYARAGHPEVHNTTIDRSTFRVYIWRDTPFGDHVLLATGPSFEPKLALASQVPAEPGVGVYVKAIVDKSPAAKRLVGGAERTATRATPKPTPAAEAAAEKVARRERAPKAAVLAAATRAAEAEGAPTVTVQHVEQAVPVAAAPVDEAAAMREAEALIKALRAMRSAS